ncbi:MAG TPA: energy transducer TonB [Rhodocyclaceae bacterium]|nr:energy transducer TonB [Rhodocyclaceae bacterium]
MNASFTFDSAPQHIPDSGKWMSLMLTVLMHAALAILLFFGVQWQSRSPEPISVDLVRSLPPVEAPPPPQVAPPPPVPEVRKPEPRPEPPPVKPDIAIKPPKPLPVKPKPEPIKKVPEPVKPKPVEKKATLDREQSAPNAYENRLAQLMKQDSDRAQRQVQAAAITARSANANVITKQASDAEKAWTDKIKSKVRGNIILPPGITGRPTAEFAILLLPTGEVMMPLRLINSSGNKLLDEAIERAIMKSSPLPLPDKPEIFQRQLNLKFDPLND